MPLAGRSRVRDEEAIIGESEIPENDRAYLPIAAEKESENERSGRRAARRGEFCIIFQFSVDKCSPMKSLNKANNKMQFIDLLISVMIREWPTASSEKNGNINAATESLDKHIELKSDKSRSSRRESVAAAFALPSRL